MTNTNRPIRRALVSVFHKEGIEVLAEAFVKAGTEVVSTGSTAKKLAELGVKVTEVSDVTGFPECLDGRVKTLHPYIHAGILADMTNPEHAKQLEEFGIKPFDLVVVNLYPFADTVRSGANEADTIEKIDLGLDTSGLTMADCSGLSPGSRLTVRTLAAVQQRNLTTESGAAGAEGLSIAGLVGTAQDRYTDDAVAGLLRVKTGSLGTVTSMAGNVSRTNGGALSFAVVVNNPEDYAAARSAIDSFITKLAGL